MSIRPRRGSGHSGHSGRPNPAPSIHLDRTNGGPLTYRVVSRETFGKDAIPLTALFAATGAPRLTLITCGGPFDSESLSYLDNVVVTAVPT